MDKRNTLTELIDGLLLGDGSVTADNRFYMNQCWNRRNWIYQIQQDFANLNITTKTKPKPEGTTIINGKQYKQQAALYLRSLGCMKEYRERWYKNGIKMVPTDVVLTPKSLAYWCCGDGYRGGKGYHLTFCTDGFNDADRELLISRLNEIYGWQLILIPSRGRLSITKNQDRSEFKNIVQSYMPDCCQYKLDLKINERRLKENRDTERQRQLAHRREVYHNRSK